MQSSAIAFSSSFSLHGDHGKQARNGFNPLSLSPAEQFRVSTALSLSLVSNSSASRRFSPIGCSLKRIGWISDTSPVSSEAVGDDVVVRATVGGMGEVESAKSKKFVDTLVLGALLAFWYLFNIYYNIYNKQVLEVYHYPVTISLAQFAAGTVIIMLMWILNIHKRPNLTCAQLVAILPLAVAHTLGSLFTNMSLGKVSVSFTHTIKAMEPFFTVILSAMFLGEFPTIWVVSSLIPVVGGVALASMTEASFNWVGFWSAMASNLTNQSRNVFSKKIMESLDNITLFSVITIMSFFLMIPPTLFMEGIKFTPSYLQSAGLNVNQIYTRLLLAAVCFHAYQQVAYMILQRVSPVTHSVSNCVKRVVVIVSSVIFFRTPVSPINALGTGIALVGVFMYSKVTRIKPNQKTA